MKLAEALNLRADIKTRLSQLAQRLSANAKTQQGEAPAEEPKELLAELDRLTAQLEELIVRINLTNAEVLFEGQTLTALLAKRDALSQKLSILRAFLSEASEKVNRYANTEIRIISTVDVAAMQKKVDALSAELRELDTAIQSLNWSSELR